MTKVQSYLAVIDDAFLTLAKRDSSLGLDGSQVHPELPQRFIPAIELGSVLLHPSTSYAARDAALIELARRSRGNEAMTMVTLGMLIPGLKRVAGQLAHGSHDLSIDIEAELVTGVLEGLAAGVAAPRVATQLITYAANRARLLIRNQERNELVRKRLDLDAWEIPSPEVVLSQAVRSEIITADEAELITASRVDGYSMEALAAQRNVTTGTLRTRRNRAERRLRFFIETGGIEK